MLGLSDVSPPVWRRLRVSSGATLARAARVFAIAMGWNPARPFAFTVGSLRYEGSGHRANGRNGTDPETGRDDPQDVRLRQVLPDATSSLEFEYGEGHPWHLTVVLERLLPPNDSLRTPFCIDGEGGAPPLEVGGPWAYEEWRGEPPPDDALHTGASPVSVPFNPEVVNAQLALITKGRDRTISK